MSYRLFRVTNLYNEYLMQYYSEFPFIKQLSYQEHHDHLTENSLDTASSFVRNLRTIGVDAFDFFSNASPLQSRWAVEHASRKSGRDLVLEQIKFLKPDVIWLDDISLIDAGWIAYLRQNVPSIKVLTGHLCAPYYRKDIENLKALDFMITCTPCLKREFEEFGIETHLFYHAFDPDILPRVKDHNSYPDTNLLFTGSLYTGGAFHMTRIDFIEELLRKGLPLAIYGNVDSKKKVFSKKSAYYLVSALRRMGAQSLIRSIGSLKKFENYGDKPVKSYSRELRRSLKPPVYGIDQFKLLSKARMTFNLHIDMAKSCAGNARLFEATGVGSCLITDWKENLAELFEPEKEVITYKSRAECIEKVKWLLQNPAEIAKIGAAGQARTLKEHNFLNRVNRFNDLVLARL